MLCSEGGRAPVTMVGTTVHIRFHGKQWTEGSVAAPGVTIGAVIDAETAGGFV